MPLRPRTAAATCAALLAAPIARAQELETHFERDVRSFFAAHCIECHGERAKKGGLDLRALSSSAVASADLATLVLVRNKLEAGEMPPPERERPAPERSAAAIAWIQRALREAPLADPGRVSLRRLTRLEYRCSVRDLFGVAVDVEERLPVDSVGAGFDTLGDLHQLSPLVFEKYVELAEDVASAAVPPSASLSIERRADAIEGGEEVSLGESEARALYSQGAFLLAADLPRAGRYRLGLSGCGDQAGPEPPRLELRSGAKLLGAVDFAQVRGTLEQRAIEIELPAGALRIEAEFANDYYRPEDPDPAARDRNVYLAAWRIEGPLDPPPRSAFQRRWVDGAGGGARRIEEIVRELLDRAWRRPTPPDDVERVLALAPQRADLDGALRTAIAAALSSPRFLYRFEGLREPGPSGGVRDLDGYELATRLSYFLWSSVPDEQLFREAGEGALDTEEGLLRAARRLLRDARASALIEGFAAQWLQLRRLEDSAPDPDLFPRFDEALRRSMRAETELFVEALLREDRPLEELLLAQFTFVDERLARHYGIAGVQGAQFRRVPLEEERRGLLAHAAVLTLTSNPARTSPVKRGKWILEVLLDAPPAPPPPEAGTLSEDARSAAVPLRERLALHRRDPSCATCHARMDALGFALEPYGPIGELRRSDAAGPIDPTGELPDGRRIEGPAGLRRVLVESGALERAALKALFVYALGRELEERDEPRLARTLEDLAATRERGDAVSLRTLIEAIVVSEAFRKRRAEERG